MTKNLIKSKSPQKIAELKFRTPDQFKGSIFSGGKFNSGIGKGQRFLKVSFKTQHKGG